MKRRSFLGAMLASFAAPAIITRPGVLMPIKAAPLWVPLGNRLVVYSGLPWSGALPLAALALPDNWLGEAIGGRAKANLGGQATVDFTGTASHFQILGPDGQPMVRGSVSAVGEGGDLVLDSASLAAGQVLHLTNLQLSLGAD